jgi:hypothetical protein
MGPLATCTWPGFASEMKTFEGRVAFKRSLKTSLWSSAAAELLCRRRELLHVAPYRL